MNKELCLIANKEILGKEFNIYGSLNEPYFLARDVAEMIDYAYKDSKRRKRDTRKMLNSVDDDEKFKAMINMKSFGRNNSPTKENRGGIRANAEFWFLTEYGLYEVLMLSRKPIAKEFKKKVKEVLKDLRTKGVVITENATKEAIDFASKFDSRRIRRTFLESTNLRADWELLKELSKAETKAGRLTGKEKIKLYNLAFASIKDRYDAGLGILRGSELMAMQELLTDIKTDTVELSNRVNGGLKSALTVKNKLLLKERDEAYNFINSIMPDAEEYNVLNLHGFSVNKQYTPDVTEYGLIKTNAIGQPKLKKTRAYEKWLLDFNKEMDKLDLNINFKNGVDIYLYFDHMEKFDCHNFHKSFFDALSKYYKIDDKLFHLKNCDTNEFVNSYEDGKIYFCIREREAE